MGGNTSTMRISDFCAAARKVSTAAQAEALVARGIRGDATLQQWLQDPDDNAGDCVKGMGPLAESLLLPAIVCAQYPNLMDPDEDRDRKVLDYESPVLLDALEKRGLNVRRWSDKTCAWALFYPCTLPWLDARVDLTGRIMRLPVRCRTRSWGDWVYRLRRAPKRLGESIKELHDLDRRDLARHLLQRLASALRTQQVWWLARKEVIDRDMLLANKGAVLRALLRPKRKRNMILPILTVRCRLTKSDLISAGITISN